MTRDQHLQFCKRCTNRKFDPQQGLVCSLTGRIADFDPTCPNFNVDPMVKDEPLPEQHIPVDVKNIPNDVREAMRQHQDLSYALVGGAAGAIVSAMIWGAVTYFTHYQIGYLAIGVGLLVGFAVRFFGAGIDRPFGIVGGAFAILGCALGNLMSQTGFVAEAESMNYFEVIPYLNWNVIIQIYTESFSPMDVVFYGIAGYEGYKFAFRPVTEALIREAQDGTVPPIRYAKLRVPLVAVLFVVVSLATYMTFKSSSAIRTTYYESGAKHYEGLVENGLEQGRWTFWWENGQVQQTGFFKDGKADSLWEYFTENGVASRRGNFRSSLEHGDWVMLYPNGQTSNHLVYAMGRLLGSYKRYNETGTIVEQGYYKYDLPDSLWETYSESGKLISKGTYSEGRLSGKWFYWFEDGKPSLEVEYSPNGYMQIYNAWSSDGKQQVKDGNGNYVRKFQEGGIAESGRVADSERVGIWQQFSETGKIIEEGEYRDRTYYMLSSWTLEGERMVNKGEGTHRVFGFEGNLVESGKVENGLREGLWIGWSYEGDTLQIAGYKLGKQHGEGTSFTEEGEIAMIGFMNGGVRDGEWKWYYQNGQLETSVVYVNGKKEGDQIFYNEDGSLLKTEVYTQGKLLEVRT